MGATGPLVEIQNRQSKYHTVYSTAYCGRKQADSHDFLGARVSTSQHQRETYRDASLRTLVNSAPCKAFTETLFTANGAVIGRFE